MGPALDDSNAAEKDSILSVESSESPASGNAIEAATRSDSYIDASERLSDARLVVSLEALRNGWPIGDGGRAGWSARPEVELRVGDAPIFEEARRFKVVASATGETARVEPGELLLGYLFGALVWVLPLDGACIFGDG